MYNTFIYTPLYNALIAIIGFVPGHDIGIAVLLLTIMVRVLLYPLSKKATETQLKMKIIEPKMKALKEQYKNNREEQGRQMLELYKREGVNPFSSILTLFIQIPIMIALYQVFLRGFTVQPEILYSFITPPAYFGTNIFGLVDVASKSLVMAIVVGVTQYITFSIISSAAPTQPKVEGKESTMAEDFAASMQFQLKYFMPFMIASVAYFAGPALSLYLLTSNIVQIIQDKVIKRRLAAASEN